MNETLTHMAPVASDGMSMLAIILAIAIGTVVFAILTAHYVR